MTSTESGSAQRVLIVDDESQIRQFLRISLKADGFEVLEAHNGAEALVRSAEEKPDMVILDLGLPDMDGVEVLERLRQIIAVPVIVLSVRDREQQKVQALNLGANDYVTKPFGVDELLARIRVQLRLAGRSRMEVRQPARFDNGDLEINLADRRVTRKGQSIRLTPKEFAILERLVSRPGQLVTQTRLLEEIWGPTYISQTHYLRIVIGRLRQKLGDDPTEQRYIETEPGVGYRFCGG